MKPLMVQDGTINYKIALQPKIADGTLGSAKNINMAVVSTPWSGFSIALKGGKILAFDPDMAAP